MDRESGEVLSYRLESSGLRLVGTVLSRCDKDAVVADYDLSELTEVTLRFTRTASDWIGITFFASLLVGTVFAVLKWAVPSGSGVAWTVCSIAGGLSLLGLLGTLTSGSALLILRARHGSVEFQLVESREIVTAFFGELNEHAAALPRSPRFRIIG